MESGVIAHEEGDPSRCRTKQVIGREEEAPDQSLPLYFAPDGSNTGLAHKHHNTDTPPLPLRDW